ncbi:MAG: acyl carrier protein [Christensenellaceae bacterium]|nr:acyl carrier protein [Christensenellaceae bacterium]
METLISILKDLHPEVDFEKENGLIDNGILNSFDIVSIIAEVDDTMGVTIPADEIIPENFNSAAALYEMIERLSDEF